ncbi:MAG TPA: choice-of-anchor Q domain-containing protein [Candidatus Syntrophosphaera thermopropionivorans]|nr:choice-of-anchor Q domain-containing protein [Candidatus Syntrophosphaera thermopropionivorans]
MKTILMILLLLPLTLGAAILHVAQDGTQAYSSVQSAVNVAADMDTILIHPGTYYENIEIIGRKLTIGSLELTTADSTYITQTVIDANQSGSCFSITEDSEITLQGLYLTNGIGTPSPNWGDEKGGAVFVFFSSLNIVNCHIIGNRAWSGAGIFFGYSNAFLSGTVIANNLGKCSGALSFAGYCVDGPRTIEFDPLNRCSIYNNIAGICGNDITIISQFYNTIDIYLDKATVADNSPYLKECITTEHYDIYQEFTYNVFINEAATQQQFADLYVSPEGDDANTGLTPQDPLKTIALAIQRIGADSQDPHTIHLANGRYAEDQHFPLNLRSYVSIIGESEEGVIFGGPDVFFLGWDSEKEVTIKNITFTATTNQEFYQRALIECITRNKIDGIPDKFSLTLENLSFRGIRPVHYDNILKLAELGYPEKLILRNITVEDCMVTVGFHLWGGNVFADNVRINNLHASPQGVITGKALTIFTNNPLFTGGDSVFQNLQITDCESRSEDGSPSGIVSIKHSFLPTQFRTYFINCTIADNHWSTGYGAAINIGEDAKVTFINSIISNEVGLNFMLYNKPLPSNLQFLNCLVGPADDPMDTIFNLGPNNTIEWFGTNLSSDPEFYAWSDDNPYTLGQESPCIDAGTTDFSIFTIPDWYSFPLYDLAGNPRIYGNQVDIGAYEWQGQTDIEDLVTVPTFSMFNYPNPFNPSTTIAFSIPETGRVRVSVYNVKGEKIKDLLNTEMTRGNHRLVWDGKDTNNRNVASGIYFIKLESVGKTSIRKAMLMK